MLSKLPLDLKKVDSKNIDKEILRVSPVKLKGMKKGLSCNTS